MSRDILLLVDALAREAAIEAVRRIMPKLNLEEGTIPPEVLAMVSGPPPG